MMYKKTLFLCCLLLSIPFLEAKRGGSGGSFGGRGSSGARTGSAGGSYSPSRGGSPQGGGFSQGGGFNQHSGGQNFGNRGGFQQPNYGNQGGFRGNSAPHYNYPSGFQQQGWNRSPGFSQGSGMGSVSRASTFKHALAGAAIGTIGGLLVWEAGKAIINSATTPFHHGGRDYYFDQQNYRGPSNVPRCSMPLSQLQTAPSTTTTNENGTSADQTLSSIQYKDGTRPKEVVWSCNVGEICCGSDCCPAPQSYSSPNGGSGCGVGWIVLLVILLLLIACCLGCFCVYKFCRSTIEGFIPRSSQNQGGYYDDGNKYDYQGQPSQSYPMTNYPPQNQQYPQNPPFGYPPQQNYNYPPNPGPRY
ncbi:CX domain-containing protein [Aphelenchoides bicaudatus]|nr:CX domain-containing protein [Aphelenchoides bicaudatus]